MARRFELLASVACLVAGLSRVSRASAQGMPTPGPGAGPYPSAEGGGLVAAAIILGLALLGALILSVAIMDLRRKRRAQAIAIEGQIADALMWEPRLTGAAITTMARVPLTGRTGPTVEVLGEVEYPELRDVAVRMVRQELLRHHSEGRVEDRIFVSSPIPAGPR